MQVRIDVGSRRNIVLFVLPGLLFLFDRLIIRPKKMDRNQTVEKPAQAEITEGRIV